MSRSEAEFIRQFGERTGARQAVGTWDDWLKVWNRAWIAALKLAVELSDPRKVSP